MIYLLIVIIICLIIKLHRTTKEKNLYYSNYKNCLLALSEYDKELVKYLEKAGEK